MNPHLDTIFTTLHRMYPDNVTELVRETPWQLLMSVILSAQTTDKQVNKVTKHIYTSLSTPQDVVDMGLEQLTHRLSAINFYKNKSTYIYKTAMILASTNHIPETLEAMITLPGVGIKTAKVVLHILYGQEYIAVDTHVHRVANRLGLVTTKTAEQTGRIIEDIIPAKYKTIAHHTMIFFGRYLCMARKPLCETCPFISFCPYLACKNSVSSKPSSALSS